MHSPRLLLNVRFSRIYAAIQDKMKPQKTRSYQGAVDTLYDLLTNAQYIRDAPLEPNKSLDNIAAVTKFLKRTDVPLETLDDLSVIHITGTNGKGSTCAYTESILRNHGYKTGFYSSPHLLDVRERIRINGKPISQNEFSKHFWKIYDLLNSKKEDPSNMPMFFRFMTILAFHVFLENKVDVAILEVGIGGEYDCTNVVRNTVVAGITPLDIDHTQLLGSSLESIAWNKSGIVKEGSVVFTAKQPETALKVLSDRSTERKCSSFSVVDGDYYNNKSNSRIPLHIQKTNASLALAISEAYIKKRPQNNNTEFSLEIARQAIENTLWPGRYEIKQRNNVRFFLDGAHTLESITVCTEWFLGKTVATKKKALIFNLTGERDSTLFFNVLSRCGFDLVIFTPNVGSDENRSDKADNILASFDRQLTNCKENQRKWLQMEENFTKKAEVHTVTSFSNAVALLNNENQYDALVTGSIHLIGSALSLLDPTLNGALSDES